MKDNTLGYLYVIIATSAWGSIYVVSKAVFGYVPPFTLMFFRYIVAAAALLIILKTQKNNIQKKKVKIERQDYKYIFFVGFVGYFISVGAQFYGTKLAGASLSSLLNSMCPVFITLFAVFFLKEKLTFFKLISIITSIAGAYIIIGGVGQNSLVIAGIILALIAVISWSIMSIVVKKISGKYDSIVITTYAIIVALIFNLPAAVYEFITIPDIRLLKPSVISSILFMGIISTALAHVCWNKSLALMEASTCSLFYPVQPMVSVLLGFIFLGEKMDISFFIGAILIIVGVLVSVYNGSDKKNGFATFLGHVPFRTYARKFWQAH